MNLSEIQLLINYNYWANARVLAAATQASQEQFTAPAGLSHGSLRGAMVHILGAEVVWRERWQEGQYPTSLLPESDFSTLESLKAYWTAEEQAMRSYITSIDDDKLNSVLHYKSTGEVARENPLWQLILHVVNHGTQFRGETAVALTRLGCSPGDLDLIHYLRESK